MEECCAVSPQNTLTSSINAQLHKICCDWIFNFFFFFFFFADIGEGEELMAETLEYTGEETKATNTQGYREVGSWVRIF